MQAVQVRHYLRRARDFYECMQHARKEDRFRNSCALLAIHSALAFSDALKVGLGDEALAGDDHAKAADRLWRRMPATMRGSSGMEHLRYLLGSKSAVAYGGQRVEAKTSALLVLRAQRFATWANETGRSLKIEGWQDDDPS